jgi:hypothetical protein
MKQARAAAKDSQPLEKKKPNNNPSLEEQKGRMT